MNRPLWHLLLVTNFGRTSRRPVRAAAVRLTLAAAAGLALGISIGRTVRQVPIPHGLPTIWLAAIVGAAAFAFIALGLLSLSATPGHRELLPKLTAVMPLGRGAQWLLELAPRVVVWSITMALAAPITAAFAYAAGTRSVALLTSLVAGSLSGVGFAMLPRPRSVIIKCLLLVAVVLISARLISVYPTLSVHRRTLALAALALLNLSSLSGFLLSYLSAGSRLLPASTGRPGILMPSPLLPIGWFELKLLRNPRGLISLLFGLTVSAAVATAVHLRHLAAAGGAGWLLLAAVMAAALACDARGLLPRRRAPEIEALHGPVRFVAAESLATLTLSLLLGLPMLITLLLAGVLTPATLVLAYLALQTSAALIGLLASTVFVPEPGDLGSQFFATAAATTALLFLPNLFHFKGSSLPFQSLIWFAVAAASYAAIIIIEKQRRLRYDPV